MGFFGSRTKSPGTAPKIQTGTINEHLQYLMEAFTVSFFVNLRCEYAKKIEQKDKLDRTCYRCGSVVLESYAIISAVGKFTAITTAMDEQLKT